MKTIRDYVYLIVSEYRKAKERGHSRYSLEWGMWSAEFNREIARRIANNDPKSFYLNHVFQLWVVVSKMLELEHKSFIRRMLDTSSLNEELESVVKILEEGMKNECSECGTTEYLRGSGVHPTRGGEGARLS